MKKVENSMETMNIPKLLLKISIPMMLSLLINSFYGVIDSIFVSQVSEDALTALSLSSPVQILIAALGCGIAVGLNSVISKALGEKNETAVKRTASAAIWLAMAAYSFIVIACIVFLKPYFRWQSKGDIVIENYGIRYLGICMLLSFGQMAQWVFDRFLIAAGKSSLFLVSLTVASITNLILDPIFIFGYFGFPAMDTAGAGLATVIGQITGAVAGIWINLKQNKEIPVHFTLKPDWKDCKNILKVGIPTAIMQGLVSVMSMFINTVLIVFSSTAVAVFGICTKIQNLVLIGVNGIQIGLIPIVAYNYGAGKRERMYQSVRWALFDAFMIMTVFTGVLVLFPKPVLYLFDASETMLSIGIPALRLLSLSFLLSSVSIIMSGFFQALGDATYSLILTLSRQVILLIFFVKVFSAIGGLELIWYSYLFAELLTIPLAVYLYKKTKNKMLNPLQVIEQNKNQTLESPYPTAEEMIQTENSD